MKKALLNKLQFDPVEHKYTLDGVELPSVTQILTRVGITKEVSEELKNSENFIKATEYGTTVHAQIEETIKNGSYTYKGVEGKALPTKELKWFESNVKPICSKWFAETRFVYADLYAGTCDLYGVNNNTLYIIDHKTGSSWSENSVRWQTFLYFKGLEFCGLLPKHKEVKFFCCNLKGSDSELVELTPPTDAEFEKMLVCIKEGTTYATGEVVEMPENLLQQATDFVINYPLFNSLKKQITEFNDSLKAFCEEKGISEISFKAKKEDGSEGTYYWKLGEPYDVSRFDTTTFKKDHKDLYDKYLTTSTSRKFTNGWKKEK